MFQDHVLWFAWCLDLLRLEAALMLQELLSFSVPGLNAACNELLHPLLLSAGTALSGKVTGVTWAAQSPAGL